MYLELDCLSIQNSSATESPSRGWIYVSYNRDTFFHILDQENVYIKVEFLLTNAKHESFLCFKL